MIEDEKHPKAKDVLLLLQDVKKSWEENKLDEAVNYLKIARFFYEELDRTNGYNGEYNYVCDVDPIFSLHKHKHVILLNINQKQLLRTVSF